MREGLAGEPIMSSQGFELTELPEGVHRVHAYLKTKLITA